MLCTCKISSLVLHTIWLENLAGIKFGALLQNAQIWLFLYDWCMTSRSTTCMLYMCEWESTACSGSGNFHVCCICGYHTAFGKLLVCKRVLRSAVDMYCGTIIRHWKLWIVTRLPWVTAGTAVQEYNPIVYPLLVYACNAINRLRWLLAPTFGDWSNFGQKFGGIWIGS